MASIATMKSFDRVGLATSVSKPDSENGCVSKDWFLDERNGVNFLINTQPSLMGIGREHQNFWGNI